MAACDVVVGLRDATFAFTEVRIGVVPAIISVPVLARMPASVVRELFLTGDTFDGIRAEGYGLLNRAVDRAELDEAVAHYAAMLIRGAPRALAATKRLTQNATLPTDLAAHFRELGELSGRFFGSDEAREGIAAQREHREPTWI